jgi:hypothetical protein
MAAFVRSPSAWRNVIVFMAATPRRVVYILFFAEIEKELIQ